MYMSVCCRRLGAVGFGPNGGKTFCFESPDLGPGACNPASEVGQAHVRAEGRAVGEPSRKCPKKYPLA